MKKTFITPKAEVKAMQSAEMICQSTTEVGVNTTQQQGGNASDYMDAGAKAGATTFLMPI